MLNRFVAGSLGEFESDWLYVQMQILRAYSTHIVLLYVSYFVTTLFLCNLYDYYIIKKLGTSRDQTKTIILNVSIRTIFCHHNLEDEEYSGEIFFPSRTVFFEDLLQIILLNSKNIKSIKRQYNSTETKLTCDDTLFYTQMRIFLIHHYILLYIQLVFILDK